jgi:hypothetical protein
LQDAAKVPQAGAEVASTAFDDHSWYAATVPGTVLTSLVNNHVYPEPLYGENDRPEIIPESLARTSYWYRTLIRVPRAYRNHHVWLNFDGINYSADVWVNGVKVGTIRGAFIRGIFDITAQVVPGNPAVVAVLVAPQPHPGDPHEHTLRAGVGRTAASPPSTGPRFSRPSAGTGSTRCAIAIPASGKRYFSRPPVRCCSRTRWSPPICRCRAPIL